VTNAAGIQPSRGDTISIGQMAFAKPVTAASGPAGGILGYAQYALIAIACAAFLFFTTRVLRRREEEPIDHEPPWLRQLELPVRLAELERATGSNGANGSEPVGAGNASRRKVDDLAASSPDRVAQQLRSWMQEE
jgi:flagellar biosynthesis/type III secretory pathway M-ring protein FliF/YscJ